MKVITTISVLSLVLITVGVTLAFYSYVRKGTTENTIQSGAINFIYTEIDGQGAGIGITDALPMSDALGEAQTGERNVFNYKIKSSNPTNKYINYTVTVRKKSTGTELDNYVKLNVKEVGGSYNKTKFYKDLPLYNNLNNERIIYQGEVTNDSNYEKDFQLRMWLSDTLTLDENTNDKQFSLTVNVYAQGANVAQSANCGDAICENQSFAQYMTAQDQAIVGQYVTLKPPTGGMNENSFNGLGYYDDWMKAFTRPFEYMKISDRKTGWNGLWYPDTNNINVWKKNPVAMDNSFAIGNSWFGTDQVMMIPDALDKYVYDNHGKHINMWFAEVDYYNYPRSGTGTRYFRLYGAYVGDNTGFKVVQNRPTQGYVVFEAPGNNGYSGGEFYTVPYNYNAPHTGTMMHQVFPDRWVYGGGTGGQMGRYILVYNVEAFKTYLENLSADNAYGLASSWFVLAECNIPDDD